MKRPIRWLILLMAAILCLSSISALAEEKVEITWLGYYTSNLTVGENTYAEKLIEDRFGVEIIPVTDVSKENMDVFISSGDISKVTCYASYLKSDFTYMYEQGLIREFPEEWLWEYYPTGMKIYSDYLGEDFFENGNHLVHGKCLYIPFTTTTNTSERVALYRKDWMEKLGLSEPTTLEELHDMLHAFTFDDPDGNGIDDTYGANFSLAWYGPWILYGAFGITQNSAKEGSFILQEDGSVIYTSATEEYKEALAIFKQWYDEGIIDPESVTDDRSACRTKWANGTTGFMCDSQTWYYSNRGSSSIAAMATEVFGEGTVDALGAITSEYGDGTVYSWRNFPNVRSNRALSFTAGASDDQIIAVLQILEGMASDHDFMLKILFGEEGVDYDWDGEQLKVRPEVSIEYMASKGISDTFYGYAATDPYIAKVTFSDQDKAFIAKSETFPMLTAPTNFTDVTNESKKVYFDEVLKLEGEFLSNVLLGVVDLEADWDQHVADMYAAGLDKILTEYEEKLN